MTWEAWFTLAVVVLTIVLLARDLTPPSASVRKCHRRIDLRLVRRVDT